MQGIQMAKEVAQKELSEQKALYEDRIQALQKELVHTQFSSNNKAHVFLFIPLPAQLLHLQFQLCVYLRILFSQ